MRPLGIKRLRKNKGANRQSTVHYSKKGEVFYGQEPPRGESTTTECGVYYQLLAVMY